MKLSSAKKLTVATLLILACGAGAMFATTTVSAQNLASVMRHTTPHFAAIWSKHDVGAWVARHGMSSSDYQAEFDKYGAQGYRLISVDGYESGGQARYAAIWRKTSGSAWVARHGLTSSEYQSAFDEYTRTGYRPTWVTGYTVQGKALYAAIWEKSSGPEWVARHGLSGADYQAAFNTYTGQGYRLKVVSGYAQGGDARYAAIWEKSPGAAWVARHGLSGSEYQSAFDEYTKQGYHLTQVSGYVVSGQARYAAIWDKSPAPAWVARHGMTSDGYQKEFDALTKQGYVLDLVSGY